ncbi:SAM-dependent methyltransferase [Nonomuraea sp. NPDC048892]|uniref:SAM-dependent methyltransferase n=1 Tax=Nonomuraea sp. NPDC048892 TaxID=3154624 RepID=UPI00340DE3EA
MTTDPSATGPGSTFKPQEATVAGTYAALRGSKNPLDPSRTAGDGIAKEVPNVDLVVEENAAALVRAVEHLARAGHDRFADLGGGIPEQELDRRKLPDLCMVAARHQPGRRWLMLDSDVLAIMHSTQLYGKLPGMAVVQQDLRRTDAVVKALEAHLGHDKPIVAILGAVLHFLTDHEVTALMAALRTFLPPGSVVVVTHATSTGVDPDMVVNGSARYEKETGVPIYLRAKEDITAYADGLELLPPGVVPTPSFLPPRPEGPPPKEAPYFLMWMARK